MPQAMLSETVKKHIRHCQLEPEKVGQCVGNGAGHVVYQYGEDSVIKIPRLRWVKHNLSIITAKDAEHSLQLAKKHFALYIPTTKIWPNQHNQSYCIVQHRLPSFENLSLKHIRNMPTVAEQFTDILRRNQQLIRHKGLSLDFFGKEGSVKTILALFRLTQPQMANVAVSISKHPSLFILDSQLFEIRSPENAHLSRRMMAEASRWGFEMNRLFAKGGCGHDLKK